MKAENAQKMPNEILRQIVEEMTDKDDTESVLKELAKLSRTSEIVESISKTYCTEITRLWMGKNAEDTGTGLHTRVQGIGCQSGDSWGVDAYGSERTWFA